MEFKETEFVPFILGGDINTYSVARAFYEAYGIKSSVFGKYLAGPSYGSRIAQYRAVSDIESDEGFLRTIHAFLDDHPNKTIILIGCGDGYTALISKHIADLPRCVAPYPKYELMDRLQRKDRFYELCEKNGVDYPDTLVYTRDMGTDFEMDFSYPVIVKSSESVTYWDHPFEGQKKVFSVNSREELEEVLGKIYGSGYGNPVIIQDTVPGNDEFMYVLTSYSNQEGKVEMMCLGHVLLEEHTPKGLGNHACIITTFDQSLMDQARALLEAMNYVGFSNFDIKYDSRDGKFKFFELNTRQGRSNFYVTASGYNIATYVADDYIYGKKHELVLAKNEYLWLVVPKKVAFTYVKSEGSKNKMRKLIREGKWVNPVFFKGDLSPQRLYRIARTHFGHFEKFKTYYR